MSPRFKHLFYQYYLAFLVPLLAGSTLAVILLRTVVPTTQILLALYSSSFSLIFFVQRQRLEELRTFKEVFSEFNGRYDKMNEDLNHLVQGSYGNDEQSLDLLYDYFNLCGEEFLYYRKGIIYPEVWKAWANGILFFMGHPTFRTVWEREEKSDSYYGLSIKRLEEITGREVGEFSD